MHLEGQGSQGPRRLSGHPVSRFDDGGFTMVVLLVVIAVMAVGMTAMLPTWRQQAIREKEEELIFRANQYARAIVLYSRKNNNVLPTSIDHLYDGKFLRRKWKDPITGEDFALLPAGLPANAGRGNPTGPGGTQGSRGTGAGSSTGQKVLGPFQGVYSTSPDVSIRVYQNQQRYSDWQFTFQTASTLMGLAGGGRGGPGGPGGTGQRGGPPGRGNPNPGGPGGSRGGPPGSRGGAPGGGGPGLGITPPSRGGGTPAPIGGRGRGNSD